MQLQMLLPVLIALLVGCASPTHIPSLPTASVTPRQTSIPVPTRTPYPANIEDLTLSPDGRLAAVGLSDKLVVLNAETLEVVWKKVGYYQGKIAFSPDSKFLAAADASFTGAVIFDSATGLVSYTLNGDPKNHHFSAISWSPDGKYLARNSSTGAVIWNIEDRQIEQRLNVVTDYGITEATWSPDGTQLATLVTDDVHPYFEYRLVIWNPQTGHPIRVLGTAYSNQYPVNVVWSPDGAQVALGDLAGDTISIWNVANSELAATLNKDRLAPSAIAWSPDNNKLAIGTWNGEVLLWEPSTGSFNKITDVEAYWVPGLVWFPDGNVLMIADDYSVMLWDVSKGKLINRKTFDN